VFAHIILKYYKTEKRFPSKSNKIKRFKTRRHLASDEYNTDIEENMHILLDTSILYSSRLVKPLPCFWFSVDAAAVRTL